MGQGKGKKEMRLIDADACQALFDAEFKETKRLILNGEKHLDNLAEGFLEASSVIKSMPTIDAASVTYGKWVKTDYKPMIFTKCSLCGHRVEIQNKSAFCPGCGARMTNGKS